MILWQQLWTSPPLPLLSRGHMIPGYSHLQQRLKQEAQVMRKTEPRYPSGGRNGTVCLKWGCAR